MAVRAAASIADKALLENRAVGHDGQRPSPGDRAGRPRRSAAPEDHAAPRRRRRRRDDAARGVARAAAGRLRRGMTAIVITPSLDRSWIRPIAALRTRGIASRRRDPRRGRREAGSSATSGGGPASRSPSPTRPPRSSGPSGPGRSATPSPSTSCGSTPSLPASRSPRPSADDRPLRARLSAPGRGLDQPVPRRGPGGDGRLVARRCRARPRPARLDRLPRLGIARRRCRRLHRRAGRLEPAGRPPRRGGVRGARSCR